MTIADNGDSVPPPGHNTPEKSRTFLRLFLQSERRVYAYILMLLPNRADAEDVLQEVSLVMWDKFDDQHPPTNFAAWGYKIAYFKVLDYYKKGRRKVEFSQEMLERIADTAAAQSDSLRSDDRREALAGCVEKLGPTDRDLLTRRYADGATVQTVSRDIGRSADALYKALGRIQYALFECVQRSLARGGAL